LGLFGSSAGRRAGRPFIDPGSRQIASSVPRAQRGFFPQKYPKNATCPFAERGCGNGELLRKNPTLSAKIPEKLHHAHLLKGVAAIVSYSAKIPQEIDAGFPE
jgi:hypothetical protein